MKFKGLLPLKPIFALLLLITYTWSCKTSEKAMVINEISKEQVEEVLLDTMVVSANDEFRKEKEVDSEPAKYNPSETRYFDLLHTGLKVSFDWKKQHLLGIAQIEATPLFYPQTQMILDAKGFDIKSIINKSNGKALQYNYDGSKLKITLDKKYIRGEKLILVIDYVAKPNEGPVTGSSAITSDKGLFFINPLGTENKPMQIWTQGETENNSRWFPTFDKPNERCTQEIAITVENKYSTLSNGKMVSSVKNNDGTRTDTWKQEKAHAPYLFMMAIGEYAWVEDKWENLPLYYIVENEYKPYAKQIFNHTPEMLGFFSKILDYKYPWDKYAQIITRDYVSGAMENTSAVIFGEFVQKTDQEMIDNDNDAIVAHEMFHHWFGDLVTCESWANLTLNEGFANYAEYLWYEHKYGKDRADMHRMNEMAGYINSSGEQGMHPLIHFGFNNKEDMFDAHSYNKGGLVLHMLRNYVGDDAFYASLNKYLKDNEYTAVEVDELRMAFEDVTGEDLNWFFNQWYLTEGHPDLKVTTEYMEESKEARIIVSQSQYPNFKIPFDIAIYDEKGNATYQKSWIQNQIDTIYISNLQTKPANIILDGQDDILAVITEEKSEAEYLNQLQYAPNVTQRHDAINKLLETEADYAAIVSIAINDKAYNIKSQAINLIGEEDYDQYAEVLKTAALKGEHSDLRIAALSKVVEFDMDADNILEDVIKNEKSYNVLSQALAMLASTNPSMAKEYAKQYDNVKSDILLQGISVVYANDNSPEAGDWLLDKVVTLPVYSGYPIFSSLAQYMITNSDSLDAKYQEKLYEMGINQQEDKFKRFMSVATLFGVKSALLEGEKISNQQNNLILDLANKIKDAKSKETDAMLLSRYASF
jgi:aminopeptidase N